MKKAVKSNPDEGGQLSCTIRHPAGKAINTLSLIGCPHDVCSFAGQYWAPALHPPVTDPADDHASETAIASVLGGLTRCWVLLDIRYSLFIENTSLILVMKHLFQLSRFRRALALSIRHSSTKSTRSPRQVSSHSPQPSFVRAYSKLYDHLSEYIVGQDKAKRTLSVASVPLSLSRCQADSQRVQSLPPNSSAGRHWTQSLAAAATKYNGRASQDWLRPIT